MFVVGPAVLYTHGRTSVAIETYLNSELHHTLVENRHTPYLTPCLDETGIPLPATRWKMKQVPYHWLKDKTIILPPYLMWNETGTPLLGWIRYPSPAPNQPACSTLRMTAGPCVACTLGTFFHFGRDQIFKGKSYFPVCMVLSERGIFYHALFVLFTRELLLGPCTVLSCQTRCK